MGDRIDPDVAAAHRWLDSFLPEEAPLQWRRMMGASGDRGKNIATVLQSPLGLGAQAAPNTVIPGSPMPVYSGDRGYRPPPLPSAPGAAPAAPQPYTTASRPSLFGPLEARRDWALAKVRELETIAADHNRSQRDRASARRGARQITRDIANYQGMPLTQTDLDADANPLLTRMDGWQPLEQRPVTGDQLSRRKANSSGDTESHSRPEIGREGFLDKAHFAQSGEIGPLDSRSSRRIDKDTGEEIYYWSEYYSEVGRQGDDLTSVLDNLKNRVLLSGNQPRPNTPLSKMTGVSLWDI